MGETGKYNRMSSEQLNDSNSTGPSEQWILLAEDDKLFAQLFSRFWKKTYPSVELVVRSSVQEVRELLAAQESLPMIAILDRHLEDGESSDLLGVLKCPVLSWSAGESDDAVTKPAGRAQLDSALLRVAEMAGLNVPLQ